MTGAAVRPACDATVEVLHHGTGQNRTVTDWTALLAEPATLAADLGNADVVAVSLGYHDVLGRLWSTPWPVRLRADLEAVVERSPASWDAFFAALTPAVPPHARILVHDGSTVWRWTCRARSTSTRTGAMS